MADETKKLADIMTIKGSQGDTVAAKLAQLLASKGCTKKTGKPN